MRLIHPPDSPDLEPDAPSDVAERPEFPVFILALPGVICLLILSLPLALTTTMRSELAVWTTTALVSIGAITSFWIIAARAREREIRIAAMVAGVGALALSLRAILLLI